MMATMNDDGQNGRSLPNGWEWTTIGNIAKINGRDIAIRDLSDDLPVTFVPMSAVDAQQGIIAEPQERPLKDVRKGFTPFSDGDVLLAKITPSMENGKAAIARNLKNGRGFGSTEFHVFRPKEVVMAEWVFHFIRQESFRRDAKANFSGTAGQLRVPSDFLVDYPIPLPPLSEQKRIVNRIEELLSDLDAGMAALERVHTGLKRYKASIVKSACEGKLLSSESSENHEDAKQLLQRLGKSALEDDALPSLPHGWCWTQLGDLSKHITSGSRGWAQYYSEDGATFIRAQDINTDKLVLVDIAHVNPPRDSAEVLRTRVQKNDLLVTITGANVTKTAKVNIDLNEAYISQHVGLVRPTLPESSDYLYYWIISPAQGRKALEKMAYGAGKPGLNLTNLRELLVALPPLDEQRRIVAEVERRLSVVGEVESAVEVGLVRAGRLRQSVLRSAFEGRL